MQLGRFCRHLAINEFILHREHKYATHIIYLDSGSILYVARGKKKQVVYDFIEHVGDEWMSRIEAVAYDINSDFQEAFQEKCPHLKIVFDHFHIVQNLNKYINNIRKDEIERLVDEGKPEEADELKGMKFLLSSSREALRRKDRSIVKFAHTSNINSPEKIYDNLIEKNRLLLICDFIKEALKRAF